MLYGCSRPKAAFPSCYGPSPLRRRSATLESGRALGRKLRHRPKLSFLTEGRYTSMSNPWTKKNPLMSMWLSSANRIVGGARGSATSAAKRAVALAQADATRQVLQFWGVKPSKPAPRKKSRR